MVLDFRGQRLRMTLDAYSIDVSKHGGMPLFTSFSSERLPSAPDPAINVLPGAKSSEHSKALIGSIEFDFNEQWTGFAALGTSHQHSSGYMNNVAGRNTQPSGAYTNTAKNTSHFTNANATDIGVRGHLRTGPVEHEITLSGNAIQQARGVVRGPTTMWASNIYAPTQPPAMAPAPGAIPRSSDSTISSIVLADTLSFFQDKYLLTLGARQQCMRTRNYAPSGTATTRYNKQVLTPALGLVINPWATPVSIYANYIEELSQGDTVTDTTAANFGEVFAPYQTKQMELGAKWDAGTLLNTLAVFQITHPSLIKDSDSNKIPPKVNSVIAALNGTSPVQSHRVFTVLTLL